MTDDLQSLYEFLPVEAWDRLFDGDWHQWESHADSTYLTRVTVDNWLITVDVGPMTVVAHRSDLPWLTVKEIIESLLNARSLVRRWTMTDNLHIRSIREDSPGGQHVGTDKSIRITHIPTGITVECDTERSMYRNRIKAMQMLEERLAEAPNE